MTLTDNSSMLPGLPVSDILTVAEVAHYLRISRAQGYALARKREFPTIKVGGRVMVLRSELIKYIQGQVQ